MLRPLVAAGGGPLPAPHGAFRVQIKQVDGGGVLTVSWQERQVLSCGVAWTAPGAAQVWPEVEGVYLRLSDSLTGEGFNAEPKEPDRLPWLAAVVHLSVYILWLMNQKWLVDFQRDLAVAMMKAAGE